MQLLPANNQCPKCKEWFHTVHICADSVKVRNACDHCDDGDGHCVFPYYGVAPHTHTATHPADWLGSTKLLPRDQWGDNFREDPECPGQGVYMRCPKCCRGEKAAPAARSET